ncbi:MAG TPA: DciA family protein [Eoetvoesiella sp.]
MSRTPVQRSKDKPAPANLTAIGWLGSDQHGANVLTTARMLISIEHAAKKVLPPALAQVCRVARIEKQQITLAVPSAAYAARLRQLAPRILQLLTEDGWNLNELNVRVQAGLLQNQTKAAPAREVVPLDDNALKAFEKLEKGLAPGPLADAVKRLLVHHRGAQP